MNTWNTVKLPAREHTPLATLWNLMRREIAEHKGMIVKTPIIIGVVCAVLMLVGMVGGVVAGKELFELSQHAHNMQTMTPEVAAQVFEQISGHYAYIGMLLAVVMPIMVFVYCVHTLFDERRTRSDLFWKSLPVSDNHVIASKALTALVVIPLVYTAVFVVLAYATIVCFAIVAAFMGWNVAPALLSWGVFAPLSVLALIPVYALWALPAVGYLLLVSAISKSKPLLVALLIPLGLAAAVGMIDAFVSTSMYFGYDMVGRLLYSVVPFSWGEFNPTNPLTAWSVVASAPMLAGIVLGGALLYTTTRIRQKQDDQTL